jgi:hypothetical protein
VDNNSDIDKIVDYIMKKNEISNVKLQKYYQLKWFLHALKHDALTFKKPSTWADPFEDFISKLTNNNKHAYVNNINITDSIYAMSTINKRSECDGMWSNFANTSGVLIHTTAKKIIKAIVRYLLDNGCCTNRNKFLNGFNVYNQLANFIKIQKIQYKPDIDIAKIFISATKQDNLDYNKLSFDMLSIKRREYEYESEYRVFLVPEHLGLVEANFLNIGYLHEIIEKVVLSPKASDARVQRLNNVLSKKYNISSDIIEKSKLYDIEYFKKEYGLS